MAEIAVHADVELDEPTLIEGFPGVGLVGKIATDHVVEQLDMTYYGSVRCPGLPRIAVYEPGERGVRPPVRLYADAERDLLALQSDVPISPADAPEFADCVTEWLAAEDVTPIYPSGYGTDDRSTPPTCVGVGTGDAGERLDEVGLDRPTERGAVSGPTGALLARADERDLDAVGLVVETNPKFPDPEAARVLLKRGLEPLADVSVEVDALVEQAEEIQQAREQLARKVRESQDDASSEAKPLRMFQ